MPQLDPEKRRRFAVDVVRRLREGGFESYLAGGCVRDHLMDRAAKDYDVATSAKPEEIRDLFGQKRTLWFGAAFGVVAVRGGRAAGQVEVATFRRDLGYSDGRHPDGVAFSSPAEDAARRDFTINGLFYDPLEDRVIDFVGGRDDIARRVIRAIGDPQERFGEDKLRLLRAVRFAATLDFEIEPATAASIREMAEEIGAVSAERIAQELRQTLEHEQRVRGVELLRETKLLAAILPEVDRLVGLPCQGLTTATDAFAQTLEVIARLESPSFALALAALLHQTGVAELARDSTPAPDGAIRADWEGESQKIARTVCQRFRLSNRDADRATWLVGRQSDLAGAADQSWAKLQRLLATEGADELLALFEARVRAAGSAIDDVEFCRAKLALPSEELNPPALLDGHDLMAHGVPEGKEIRVLLERIRDAQLEGRIGTKAEALALAGQIRSTDS